MQEIENFWELEKLFHKRFQFDKNELIPRIAEEKKIKRGLNNDFVKSSNYTAYPPISLKPKYCFVGLEPNYTLHFDRHNPVNYHFTGSLRTLMLQYLAYQLCDNSFDYHLTNICKTPMSLGLANIIRMDVLAYSDENSASWYDLFEKEIALMGNPKIICIGQNVSDYVEKNTKLEVYKSIFHYSSSVNSKFIEQYNELGLDVDSIDKEQFIDELKEFAKILFLHIKISPDESSKKIKKMFEKDISDLFIKKYLVYKEQLRK